MDGEEICCLFTIERIFGDIYHKNTPPRTVRPDTATAVKTIAKTIKPSL